MMDTKQIEYFEFLNEVLAISENMDSIQKNINQIILENYDLKLFKYKLEKKIAKLNKALLN
ncbi:hypothetical protein LCGC14_1279410 [marine sediment metagenome]|uniref:Uncharacterized protein n=1 Tax=marine sediment metagenome TaxID=412755 RepID=A0A0F9NCD3_9ZZZZ